MLTARKTPEADAIGYELAMGGYPEPIRQVPVTGTWAYLDRLEASPGTGISVHVSAEAAHEIEFVRLGLKAVIDPGQSLAEDCADVRRTRAEHVELSQEPLSTRGRHRDQFDVASRIWNRASRRDACMKAGNVSDGSESCR